MTVATIVSRVAYTGDGVTVAFAVPYPFFEPEDLTVIERTIATGVEVAKALGTDYTVAGGAGSTGTVTAAVAPASSVQWIILRATPLTQLIDYVSNDGFPAETHESGLDRAAMRDQEVREQLDRSLKFPQTDPDTLDPTLPSSIERANKVLGFDANGNPDVFLEIPEGSIVLPVAIADGGTGATTAAGARTALGAVGTGDANVFTATQTVRSSDAGAGVGPEFVLDRASASPVASDVLGAVRFDGKDAAGNTEAYARIEGGIVDPANGSEDGIVGFLTKVAGTLARRFLVGAGLYDPAATGGDPGAGWINVSGGFKKNNVEMGVAPAGTIVARTVKALSAVVTVNAAIPADDTVPQSAEGVELTTQAHTAQASANRLLIRACVQFGKATIGNTFVVALFKDSDASALAAVLEDGQENGVLVLEHEMAAGSTSEITFKLRVGTSAGTAYVNANSSGTRIFNTIPKSCLTIEELKV